jgi:hypothetical protein
MASAISGTMEVATISAVISSLFALRERGALEVTVRGARLVFVEVEDALFRVLALAVFDFAEAVLVDLVRLTDLVAFFATCVAVAVRVRPVVLCLALLVAVLFCPPAFRVPLGTLAVPVEDVLLLLVVPLVLLALELVFDFMLFVFVNALAVVTVNYLPERENGSPTESHRGPADMRLGSEARKTRHLGGHSRTLYDISGYRCIWRAATPASQNVGKKLLPPSATRAEKGGFCGF